MIVADSFAERKTLKHPLLDGSSLRFIAPIDWQNFVAIAPIRHVPVYAGFIEKQPPGN
jgi:hypothetical protein